jgi:hypothetical protein
LILTDPKVRHPDTTFDITFIHRTFDPCQSHMNPRPTDRIIIQPGLRGNKCNPLAYRSNCPNSIRRRISRTQGNVKAPTVKSQCHPTRGSTTVNANQTGRMVGIHNDTHIIPISD